MTREEIAAIDKECEQQHISQHEYLDSHGIARHQYYRWKRRYREEDEQSLVPAGSGPDDAGCGSISTYSAPEVQMGKAIVYTYTLLPRLSRYVLDSRYNIDNNGVENAIRPFRL